MLSDAQKRATAKYKAENYKTIKIEIPKTEYEALEAEIAKTGEAKAAFIRRAIKEAIKG